MGLLVYIHIFASSKRCSNSMRHCGDGFRLCLQVVSDAAPSSGSKALLREKIIVRIKKTEEVDCRRHLSKKKVTLEGDSSVTGVIETILAWGTVRILVQVGRSFYFPEKCKPLGYGTEGWRGFYQSTWGSIRGMILNLDTSCAAFFKARS